MSRHSPSKKLLLYGSTIYKYSILYECSEVRTVCIGLADEGLIIDEYRPKSPLAKNTPFEFPFLTLIEDNFHFDSE